MYLFSFIILRNFYSSVGRLVGWQLIWYEAIGLRFT